MGEDLKPRARVTIEGERDIYGDGTVVSTEGNCVNVLWDSDGKVMWSFPDDIVPIPTATSSLPLPGAQ